MTRSEARERLMQLLFQMEAKDDYSEELKNSYIKEHFPGTGQKAYAENLCTLIAGHLDEIDSKINECADRWSTKRMPKVDLAIMRVAVGEIFYLEDVPDAVAVNEAVGLAGKFGTDDSNKFINGVLGNVISRKNEKV